MSLYANQQKLPPAGVEKQMPSSEDPKNQTKQQGRKPIQNISNGAESRPGAFAEVDDLEDVGSNTTSLNAQSRMKEQGRDPIRNISNGAESRPGAFAEGDDLEDAESTITSLNSTVAAASGVSRAESTQSSVPHPPGAFALGTTQGLQVQERIYEEDYDASSAPQQDTDDAQVSNDRLAVANLVDEENPPDLPHAQEFDSRDETEQVDQKDKKFKALLLLGGIVVVAIAGILVAVLYPRKDSSPSGNEDTLPVAPTGAPTIDDSPALFTYQGHVLSLFPKKTLKAIDTQDSPQLRAFQWLMSDTEHEHSLSDDRIKSRFALATLYYAMDGDNWIANDNWLDHSIHECDWYNQPEFSMKTALNGMFPGYLSGFPSTEPTPTTCNVQGQYQHLWLDVNNLVGSLPLELYWLTSLKTMSMGQNPGLHGTLSSHVGMLTSLQGLAFFLLQEEFGGPIPTEIGLLTDLRALSLFVNNHEGLLPSELWQLTKLDTLGIGSNPLLQGTIPSQVGNFPDLRWLIMDDCGLTGTIPTEIGQAKSLEWLILSKNSFSSALPTQVGQLSAMTMMSLRFNALDGQLPSQLGLLTSLSWLSLRDNQVTGSIPSEFGLLRSLTAALDLRHNQFLQGQIPSQLAFLTSLEKLALLNNSLTGPIPSELGQMTSLGHLSLANNSLSGLIPQELSELSLYTLQLDGNPGLAGTVPEHLCSTTATCTGFAVSSLVPCEDPFGLSFDCTSLLCGCGCSCEGVSDEIGRDNATFT